MYQTTKIPELIDPQATYTIERAGGLAGAGDYGRVRRGDRAAARRASRGFDVRQRAHQAGSSVLREGRDASRGLLSDAGFAVISGGGPGLMEAANRGAFAGKSPAIGLNILLPHEKGGNEFQDVGFDFRYFFARKMMFVRFASAYVVLPGGFGTLDELSECLTLVQTGKSRRIPDHPRRRRVLARARRLDARQARRRRHGRRGRPRPDAGHRGARGDRRGDLRFLRDRAASSRRARSAEKMLNL